MDSLDTITLLAFLAALMRLDNSLPADLQKQLNEIGQTFPSNVSKLHTLAKSYALLEQDYQAARLALQKDGERFRLAEPELDESAQLSDEKIINFAVEILNSNDSLTLPSLKAWGFLVQRGNLLRQDYSSFSSGHLSPSVARI